MTLKRTPEGDKAVGSGKELGGRLKEAAGALTGNRRLKGEGQADQAEGRAQQVLGDVKRTIKDITR
ncbi:MAG TPA: CsbD family protein [Azospirillaceae bacterium]|nr:CsbD family protein [Azospirillaceae bacterium]